MPREGPRGPFMWGIPADPKGRPRMFIACKPSDERFITTRLEANADVAEFRVHEDSVSHVAGKSEMRQLGLEVASMLEHTQDIDRSSDHGDRGIAVGRLNSCKGSCALLFDLSYEPIGQRRPGEPVGDDFCRLAGRQDADASYIP